MSNSQTVRQTAQMRSPMSQDTQHRCERMVRTAHTCRTAHRGRSSSRALRQWTLAGKDDRDPFPRTINTTQKRARHLQSLSYLPPFLIYLEDAHTKHKTLFYIPRIHSVKQKACSFVNLPRCMFRCVSVCLSLWVSLSAFRGYGIKTRGESLLDRIFTIIFNHRPIWLTHPAYPLSVSNCQDQ